jgi:hypothetical protein
MYNTKNLAGMTEKELQEEWGELSLYIDKCALLCGALVTEANGAETLLTYYAGQPGHDVFMMALTVVRDSCTKRAQNVAQRISTLHRFMQEIEAALHEEPEHTYDWEAFEALAWPPTR